MEHLSSAHLKGRLGYWPYSQARKRSCLFCLSVNDKEARLNKLECSSVTKKKVFKVLHQVPEENSGQDDEAEEVRPGIQVVKTFFRFLHDGRGKIS